MNKKQIGRWMSAALLLAMGGTMGWAGDLAITSYEKGGDLVFRTSDGGTADHHYRVESTTSLVSAAWTSVRTASGIDASASVTNGVSATASAAYYRVVATSNSAVFVDGRYLAVDLSGGPAAGSYPVAYYQTGADVPGGANSDTYKTAKMLMRLIPKGTFIMGSPSGELGHYSNETQHQVTLTKDFYIGVFEVTQRQWELVMGDKPSYFTNATHYATRPVERVSYYEIRESPLPVTDASHKGSAISPNWPASSQTHADSFMGKLRSKTGLASFDLPTESQWEYACRAGTAAALNSGSNLTSTSSDPRMAAVGRYWYNGGSGYTPNGDTSVGTAKVGSYTPNAWGLYDMHGNVWEWCLDWYWTYPGTVTDPAGASSGSSRVVRGGGWNYNALGCRSARRYYGSPDDRSSYYGFRACFAPSGQP